MTADKISEPVTEYRSQDDIEELIKNLESDMNLAAKALAFEKAADIRDQIMELKKILVFEF